MHTVACPGAGILGQWLSPMPGCSRWSIQGAGGSPGAAATAAVVADVFGNRNI